MMQETKLLLYNFTADEVGKIRRMLKNLPNVWIRVVPKTEYHMTINQILMAETAKGNVLGRDFSRHMLILANAQGPILHFILGVCKQATEEKILRAILTETNMHWSGIELYHNLLEEEKQLGG